MIYTFLNFNVYFVLEQYIIAFNKLPKVDKKKNERLEILTSN
jgi:hypothetical protein